MSITFLIPFFNKVKTVRNVYQKSLDKDLIFEFVSLICKKNLKVGEIFIDYKLRENFGDKKIKFYHMFNAIYGILKVEFNK